MGCFGNLIWLIFGGLIIAFEYVISGLIMCVTIIGIPWGIQAFKLASLAIWPFDRKVVFTDDRSSLLYTFFNLIWLLLGGIWISLTHLIMCVILCVTIIGIPWGIQHYKLAHLALTPFGAQIISSRDE